MIICITETKVIPGLKTCINAKNAELKIMATQGVL